MAIDVKELMAKVGKIRILTNRLIDDQLSGDYHSTFKGQGVEFDEVRPYVAGDDVRSIDWNVTARTGTPFIKRFSEERELTVMFLVDVSGSQTYGSVGRSKAEVAAEVSSLLALTAIRNQDKIGLILFSDKIVKYIPPRKGRQSVMRLVREVLAAEDEAMGGTDIAGALRFLNGVQKRRAVVFLVSDFQEVRAAGASAEQAAGCSAFEIVAGMSQNRTPRIAVVKAFFAYGLMNSGGVYAPLKKATAFAEKELESSGYVTVTGEVYEQLAEDCGFLFQ